MATLAYYQSLLSKYNARIKEQQAKKQSYLNTASKIKEIYDRMAEDKSTLKSYRKSVKTFKNETYDNFKGSLYKNKYKTKMEALLSDYDTVISNLDTNMDRLNTAMANYENKAYKCDGVIGTLKASVNTVTHIIQNWTN